MMPSDPPAFAADLAEDLSPEDFIHVLTLLKEDVVRLLDDMDTATARADVKAFRAAAHGMAGAAGTVGADALEQSSRLAMTRPDLGSQLAPSAAEIRKQADIILTHIAGIMADGTSPA
jgi:HPt (histidine-containing phosphotransfer) domain-containing protein